MLAPSKPAPSSKLVLTSILSCGLTIIFSLMYTILSIIALIFRYDCAAATGDSVGGSDFFVASVFRAYIQDADCLNAITLEGITTDYTVFVMTAITLSASFVCLVMAIVYITVLVLKSEPQFIKLLAYGYVGACGASLAVDLTFATHFGIDYTFITDTLNNSSPGLSMNYMADMVRIGAILLMTLSLKGFIGHVINIVLLVLLVIYLLEYSRAVDEYEHSIHKMGILKAFDSRRNTEQPKCASCQANMANGNGGSQLNFGYMSDDEPPRSLTRENSRRERDDFSNPSFDRSYSWQQGPSPAQRPFSYLEEAKRAPPRAPPSPAPVPAEPQWRRGGWPQPPPPVPAPDYSPHGPRRLKSALKPNYM